MAPSAPVTAVGVITSLAELPVLVGVPDVPNP
jgi:hypothetical protein